MTLSKRKSRLINIDGVTYRWAISPNDRYIVFIAEHEGIKGCKIEVFIDSDINNFWVEFPYVKDLNLKVIKPTDVSFIIKKALEQEWKPSEKGTPLVFDLKEGKLIKR